MICKKFLESLKNTHTPYIFVTLYVQYTYPLVYVEYILYIDRYSKDFSIHRYINRWIIYLDRFGDIWIFFIYILFVEIIIFAADNWHKSWNTVFSNTSLYALTMALLLIFFIYRKIDRYR